MHIFFLNFYTFGWVYPFFYLLIYFERKGTKTIQVDFHSLEFLFKIFCSKMSSTPDPSLDTFRKIINPRIKLLGSIPAVYLITPEDFEEKKKIIFRDEMQQVNGEEWEKV